MSVKRVDLAFILGVKGVSVSHVILRISHFAILASPKVFPCIVASVKNLDHFSTFG